MLDLNKLTAAQHRARYAALQQAARARAERPAPPTEDFILDAGMIKNTETIPPGAYIALRLRRFDVIRITNSAGSPGAALFLWNAEEPSERYNAGDTVKLQWTTKLTTGRGRF